MPRVGKKPISIPTGVEATLNGQTLTVKGPKGTLSFVFHHRVKCTQADNQLVVTVNNPDEKKSRELWGTSRVLAANMITGVTAGFSKQLEISGVGFRAAVSGNMLTLQVGFSHPVEFSVPEGIAIKVEKNIITVSGIDKQLVGQTAARIRDIKKPEPYKGKGIKYVGEVIRRKEGKVVKAAGA